MVFQGIPWEKPGASRLAAAKLRSLELRCHAVTDRSGARVEAVGFLPMVNAWLGLWLSLRMVKNYGEI